MGKQSHRRKEDTPRVTRNYTKVTWKTCDGETNLSKHRCMKCGADPEGRCRK